MNKTPIGLSKITKKKRTKICGLSRRRIRQIVRQRFLDDIKFLRSQNDSLVALKSNFVEASDALTIPPLVKSPYFSNTVLSTNAVNSNIGNNSASLLTCSEENSSRSHVENDPFNFEASASYDSILNYESDNSDKSDSDLEVTCNEDARNLDSDLEAELNETSEFPHNDENDRKENEFSIKLRDWALKFHITLIAHSALLLLLRVFDPSLPLDARTLLGTLKRTEIVEMSGGSYYHFGLKRAIENILLERERKGIRDQNIKLILNVDGLPISKSGTNSFWLLLCSEINSETVYPVCCFYGTKKPLDANEFLDSFLKEAITLCENGLKNTNVSIEAVVCDAPAKSFVFYLKGHTGYGSCSKCLITGECHRPPSNKEGKKKRGRVCFPGTGPFILKNDKDFALNKYNDLESGMQTIFTNLPGFGCVSSVPLDYMHLILLGVMKKLISLWIKGSSNVRLPADVIQTISERLLLLRNSTPEEFNRKPRSLWEFKYWKATEFRTFLLYAGVVVLKNVTGFPRKLYSHFLLLHTAVSILVSDIHLCDQKNIDTAQEMLEFFVKDFGNLYGKENISYNVHNLLHICEDVKRYGILDNFSAFRFENYMSTIKKMLRKGDKPLQQIARRYAELEDIRKKCFSVKEFILQKSHNRGPLTEDSLSNVLEQYKIFKSKGFSIDCSVTKNSCVLLKDGTFLITENIVKCGTNDIRLIGHKLCFKGGLYDTPDSRLINIHMTVDDNKHTRYCVPLADVLSKAWRIPTSKGEVVIPLLHRKKDK